MKETAFAMSMPQKRKIDRLELGDNSDEPPLKRTKTSTRGTKPSSKDVQQAMDQAQKKAEDGKLDEALQCFDDSLHLWMKIYADDKSMEVKLRGVKAFEGKSQVLLLKDKTFEAIMSATKAVNLIKDDPKPWYIPYLTLARAQRNHGSVRLAAETLRNALVKVDKKTELSSELSDLEEIIEKMDTAKIESFVGIVRAKKVVSTKVDFGQEEDEGLA